MESFSNAIIPVSLAMLAVDPAVALANNAKTINAMVVNEAVRLNMHEKDSFIFSPQFRRLTISCGILLKITMVQVQIHEMYFSKSKATVRIQPNFRVLVLTQI